MKPVRLPNTDVDVFPLGLGVASLGARAGEAEGKCLLDRFVARGGNLIDTARVYSDWVPGELHRSERILGDWLAERKPRDRVVVCTKGGHPQPLQSRQPRLAHEQLREDLCGSLQSLRVERVDLYWLHRDDPALPVASVVESLHAFQQEGLIRFYGASNWAPERIAVANAYAREHGYTGFVASQVEWNPGTFYRRPGGDSTLLGFSARFLRLHCETGLAAIPYASQAGGYFSKRSLDPGSVVGNPYDTPQNRAVHTCLCAAANELGYSINQTVLAYLGSHPFPVIPLVGSRTPEQLDDSLSAAGLRLPVEALCRINRLLGLSGVAGFEKSFV